MDNKFSDFSQILNVFHLNISEIFRARLIDSYFQTSFCVISEFKIESKLHHR